MTLEELEAMLEKQQKQIDRIEAYQQIQNCMAGYEADHTAVTMYREPLWFAMEHEDVSMEVSDWGVWKGPEAVNYLFGTVMKEKTIGTMFLHPIATPYIEVAADGETARGTWVSVGEETQVDADLVPHGFWSFGHYSGDFIKENGVWKIWHLKWWRLARTEAGVDWTKTWQDVMTGPPKVNPYKSDPITFFHPYDTVTEQEPFPYVPMPYETWDDNKDWVFGPWKDEYFAENTPVSQFEKAHPGRTAGKIENNPSAFL